MRHKKNKYDARWMGGVKYGGEFMVIWVMNTVRRKTRIIYVYYSRPYLTTPIILLYLK